MGSLYLVDAVVEHPWKKTKTKMEWLHEFVAVARRGEAWRPVKTMGVTVAATVRCPGDITVVFDSAASDAPEQTIKDLIAREFEQLAHKVPVAEFMGLAFAAGVSPTDLIRPLLTARGPPMTVAEITCRFMELVQVYGAKPRGQAILDDLFTARRISTKDSKTLLTCSCCAPKGDPDAFFDTILDYLRANGTDVVSAAPGRVTAQVFWSLDPNFLRWFLTRYPDIDLTVAPCGSKNTPYSVMFNHRAVTQKEEVEAMDEVLRSFGHDRAF
jgi:hypothetical protein